MVIRMGARRAVSQTLAAIDELGTLLTYLQVWGIERNVIVDALMAPNEDYFDGIYFQVPHDVQSGLYAVHIPCPTTNILVCTDPRCM